MPQIADGEAANSARNKINTAINTVDNLSKASVGLGDVDNTSDEDKPVSTPQQAVFDQKLGVQDIDVTDIQQGEQKILTVTKNVSDEPEVGDAILLVDRYAANGLLAQLSPANAWVDFERTLNGDNTGGALGQMGQTLVSDREKYDCISSDNASATWKIRFNSDILVASYSQRHTDIIAQLENAAGWANNFKVINTINCYVGEKFFDANDEGYQYTCIDQVGTAFTWKRMQYTPETIPLYFNNSEKPTLVAAIDAHDFDTNGWYDQSVLAANDRAEIGRKYADTVNEHIYEVMINNKIARIQ